MAKNIKNFTKDKEQKDHEKIILFSMFIPPLIILVLSLLAYVVTLYFSYDTDTSLVDILFFWVKNLCPVAISISAGTLLYEFIGNVKYAEKRLENIIVKKEFIDTLSYSQKQDLRNTLIRSIYSDTCPDLLNDSNNITTLLAKDMINVLEDYYYEYKKYYIDITREKDYILKTIKLDYKAKAINGKEHILVPHVKVAIDRVKKPNAQSKNDSSLTKDDFYNSLELKELTINGKSIPVASEVFIGEDEKSSTSTYEFRYSSQQYIDKHKELFEFKDEISGSITYTSIAPLNDLTFTARTPKACKYFSMNVKSNAFRIEPVTFVFNADPNNNEYVSNNSNLGVDIEIADWMLPGEGVTFVLKDNVDN